MVCTEYASLHKIIRRKEKDLAECNIHLSFISTVLSMQLSDISLTRSRHHSWYFAPTVHDNVGFSASSYPMNKVAQLFQDPDFKVAMICFGRTAVPPT